MEMIDLMQNLNIFNIVDKVMVYPTLVRSLLMILMYDKNSVKFVSACNKSEKTQLKDR